jgi:hypothetical protein
MLGGQPPLDINLLPALTGMRKPAFGPPGLRMRRFFRGDYPALDWDEERS